MNCVRFVLKLLVVFKLYAGQFCAEVRSATVAMVSSTSQTLSSFVVVPGTTVKPHNKSGSACSKMKHVLESQFSVRQQVTQVMLHTERYVY